jgi:Holliday junction DNA helicase RuvA
MITQLSGKLIEKNPTSVVIDCGGVGYEVNISLHTFEQLTKDEHIKLFTYLLVREDAQVLYGFAEKVEREVFKKLISVSGIGANTARLMFSSLSPAEIIEAICTSDVDTIKSIKGIGIKTAQRVIIDLKDKLGEVNASSENLTFSNNTNRNEALSALETLGYSRKQVEKIVARIVKIEPQASVEFILKQALKNL